MTDFVAGLLTMGYTVVALYFLRFWRQSRERLFFFFSIAFALLALQRMALALVTFIHPNWLYAMRLLAFLLLLGGIIEKNRKAPARPHDE